MSEEATSSGAGIRFRKACGETRRVAKKYAVIGLRAIKWVLIARVRLSPN